MASSLKLVSVCRLSCILIAHLPSRRRREEPRREAIKVVFMALFKKMESRRQVKFTSSAWTQTSSAWRWYYSFSLEISLGIKGYFCCLGVPNLLVGSVYHAKNEGCLLEVFIMRLFNRTSLDSNIESKSSNLCFVL